MRTHNNGLTCPELERGVVKVEGEEDRARRYL
jgi:hypothetical protein